MLGIHDDVDFELLTRVVVLAILPMSNSVRKWTLHHQLFRRAIEHCLGKRPADKIIYIFRNWVGSSDESRPSKARRPVLNLGTFLVDGAFLPLASSRGTSASPLATRQNSPGIWTRRRCPKKTLSTLLHTSVLLSDPPRTTLFRSRVQPWKLDSCMQTRSCRISKVVHASMC